MTSLQEEEGPIDIEIVEALVSCLPEAWGSAALEVERERAPGHRITIRSREARDVVVPTAEIMLGVRKLELLFERHGCPFTKATYTVSRDGDGNWDFAAAFEYP